MSEEPENSLQFSEDRAAEGATAPRVTLDDIISKIAHAVFFTGGEAAAAFGGATDYPANLNGLTVCLLTMANGFTVVGKSAPASLENFDAEKGREFAHEDAIRQLWTLEGYLLCSDLAFPPETPLPEPLVIPPHEDPIETTVIYRDGTSRTFREV